VHGHEESWGGHQDELQRPQTHVGNGEKVVVADTIAARLEGVADEGRLLITPHALGSHHQHHDSEDEDDREPYSANGSRMGSGPWVRACVPIHHRPVLGSHMLLYTQCLHNGTFVGL
uniref:Uncharacterized protein n=1 Tax=Bos mutus grunniens TaxID=30521 RepID=A0A8B9YTR4_BOSMU